MLFCVRNILNIGWIAMKLGTAPLVMNSISFGDPKTLRLVPL